MTRKQFIQLSIIAPIAGFFGVKAVRKKNDLTEENLIRAFTKFSAKEAGEAMEALSKSFKKGEIAGKELRKRLELEIYLNY